MLQRLTASGPSDRVAKALSGLGRLVKTRNILRYLHDAPLHLRIQTQLNRGEARHGLARWLFFADQGEFRTADFEMIMNKTSCLSLLSNAVVLWNTLQIERIIMELRSGGTTIRDEDLVHVRPLQRRHITPSGSTSPTAQCHASLPPVGTGRSLIGTRPGTTYPRGQFGVQYATV